MTAVASGHGYSHSEPRASKKRVAINPWAVAVVVSIATFMEVLDTSIANVAVPHIAGGTASTPEEATWVLTSYLVANAVVLPASGWLSTVIGRKRFYMTCVALFTISSFLCGIAPNLGMLIVCRVFQGIGGGGLAPSEQAILADTFEPKKRGMAFALYGVVVVVAPAIGPTFGGWITDNFNWRWIFFINVPIGLISLFFSHMVVQDPPDLVAERKKMLKHGLKIDYFGFGLLALGLGCLQVVLDKGQEDDWFGSTFICCTLGAAVFGLVFGLIWEFTVEHPILDTDLLKDRTFGVSVLVMFAIGLVLFGTTIALPLLAQTMLGYTAELAGLVITPGGLFVMCLMPVVGYMINHVAARYLVMIGLAIEALAIYHMTSFDLHVSFSTLVWARIYQASGLAFLFIPINTAAYANLPRDKSNDASALMNLARNMGGSVGISLVSTLITRRGQFHQTILAGHVIPTNPASQRMIHGMVATFTAHGGSALPFANLQARRMIYQMVQQQSQMLAYIDVFRLLALGCALMIPLLFLIKANKPGEGGGGGH
ncbi:MAG TPA: DHA2 family efflux MFS transporter permease subunit [Tepidisphaeraceae bacterium]|jgi:DHA2 family multidrug resistance protein|nr:DHA2 family efflux MFS transporter permease subunit [Tepidisphaeraceae bacterium]